MLVILATGAAAHAEGYPSKPVRMVVPFPPGGGADTLARLLGQQIAARLGQPAVVDNRGGAGGLIGTGLVATSLPDGYTLLFATSSTHGSNPSVYKKLPYDPIADFSPVILLAVVPNVLVVHPSVAAGNLKELIALAKANPGKLNYASVGNGSSQHLVAELFNDRAGLKIVHVPYKGTGPALTELMAGQVQMMFTNLITSMSHLQAGRLRGLGVTSRDRSSILPALPAIAEVLPGFEMNSWYGLVAPRHVPAAVVARLNKEVAAILATPQFQERLAAGGAEPVGGTPREFATFIEKEIGKYAEAVRIANVIPQ